MQSDLHEGAALPLVDQIVTGMRQRIDDRVLRVGTRLPSIRQFAATRNVSRFTVVEAYDRLVALGYLNPRRGSGFYVAARAEPEAGKARPASLERAIDEVWLMRRVLEDDPGMLKAGGGVLRREWFDEEGLQRNIRALARKAESHLTGYGHPQGYAPLRECLQLKLAEIDIGAGSDQVVLTSGATQALDITIRYLLKPDDAVLVDDPGYFNLFGNLKLHGIRLIGVPRTPAGPDIAALEKLAAEHRPKAYFTHSVLHNPTATNLTAAAAFRVLQIAEKRDFVVVEDDIYADFHGGTVQRLAGLDQLQRVIYIGSFSKVLSASLRVGFVACRPDIAANLADIKMLSCITTSEFNERLVYSMLTEGHYRKHVERLRGRLAAALETVVRRFERLGLEIFTEPEGGMFLWARLPGHDDSVAIANRAAEAGIMLAPGNVFRPHLEASPWLRFNVAFCDNAKLYRFLETVS